MIFGKTGTIKYGTPVVEKVISLDGDADEILRKAASVEQFSSHPVATSLAREEERSLEGFWLQPTSERVRVRVSKPISTASTSSSGHSTNCETRIG